MCIYFIQAEQGGLIKIGFSINPPNRLYNLQMSCPIPLKILATIKDMPQPKESGIHSQLDQWRKYGEWFKPSIEVLLFMRENAVEFGPPPPHRFEDDFVTIVGGQRVKRCKGYSTSRYERCKRGVTWDGGDYCHSHQP